MSVSTEIPQPVDSDKGFDTIKLTAVWRTGIEPVSLDPTLMIPFGHQRKLDGLEVVLEEEVHRIMSPGSLRSPIAYTLNLDPLNIAEAFSLAGNKQEADWWVAFYTKQRGLTGEPAVVVPVQAGSLSYDWFEKYRDE